MTPDPEWNVLVTVSRDVEYRVSAPTREAAKHAAYDKAQAAHPFSDVHHAYVTSITPIATPATPVTPRPPIPPKLTWKSVEDFPLAPCPKCGTDATTAYDFRSEKPPYEGVTVLNRWHGSCGWSVVPEEKEL